MIRHRITSITGLRRLALPILAMGLVILAANILVAHPLRVSVMGIDLANWITFGAFAYPAVFLVTDLVNRFSGPGDARRVAVAGFAIGVLLSLLLAEPRIAMASGSAFLLAQLMNITVFDRLRRGRWWRAPLISSLVASALDTGLFFALAFAGTGLPWISLALGDFAVKLLMAGALLPLFRAITALSPRPAVGA